MNMNHNHQVKTKNQKKIMEIIEKNMKKKILLLKKLKRFYKINENVKSFVEVCVPIKFTKKKTNKA